MAKAIRKEKEASQAAVENEKQVDFRVKINNPGVSPGLQLQTI